MYSLSIAYLRSNDLSEGCIRPSLVTLVDVYSQNYLADDEINTI